MNKIKRYELHYGDCLDIMKDIQDKSIDLILCDPPYGTTACRWDSIIDLEKMWEQYNRIIKDNGAIVLFSAQPLLRDLVVY
jgi:DNA modification methylase